jgi:hypothetical protein
MKHIVVHTRPQDSVSAPQIEPVSSDVAIVIWNVEIVRIFPERTRHRHGFLATVTTAEARWAGVSNLDAKIALCTTMIVVA